MERPRPDAPPVTTTAGTRLMRSAGFIGIATAASRVLGLVRDQVLAHHFGAGHAMDAFFVAFKVPNLLRDLFAEGAMTAAFVPTFTRTLTLRGREEAWRLGNLVVNALAGVTLVLGLLGIIFAEPIIGLVAGKYAAVPGKLELAVSLARVMFPFLTLVALAAACMGMLNSLRRFFVPALSPAMFNVGTILTVLALVPVAGVVGFQPIYAVAVGTLVGGALQILIQWPLLHREGYRYRPVMDLRDEGLRQLLVLMAPGTIGLAAVQINVLVNTYLATGEGSAVSWLNYAFRLMYLPIGLFGVSIATAALPAISTHAATDDRPGMRRTVSSALRLMLMLNVPATVGLVVLAEPIIGLLFEHGRFTSADTSATAQALVFYAPGLIGYSAVKIAAPTFYALHESRTPVMVSAATVGLNVALNLALVRVMGYRGLAFGTAVAAIFNAGCLLAILRRRLAGIDGSRVAVATLKVLIASGAMGLVAHGSAVWVQHVLGPPTPLSRLVSVAGAIGAGMLTLAAAARALRIAEFNEAVAMVWGRITGRRASR